MWCLWLYMADHPPKNYLMLKPYCKYFPEQILLEQSKFQTEDTIGFQLGHTILGGLNLFLLMLL